MDANRVSKEGQLCCTGFVAKLDNENDSIILKFVNLISIFYVRSILNSALLSIVAHQTLTCTFEIFLYLATYF